MKHLKRLSLFAATLLLSLGVAYGQAQSGTVILSGQGLAEAKAQARPVTPIADVLPAVTSGPLPGHTPSPVLDGTARLMSHYNPGQMLRLTLAIRPPHMAEEEQFLAELQTKGSPNFHQFLTADEWNTRFGPSVQDEQAVVNWATSVGLTVTNRFANRLLVDVEAPAGVIEKAFGVTINNYQVGGELEFSTDRDPMLPNSLTGIVYHVGGLNSIQRFQRVSGSAKKLKGPDYVPGPVYTVGQSSHGDGDATKAPTRALANRASSMASGPSSSPVPSFTSGYADPSNIPYSSESYNYNGLLTFSHCCNVNNDSTGSPPASSIALVTLGNFQASDVASFFTNYGMAWNWNVYSIDGESGPVECVPGASGCPVDAQDNEAPLDVEYSGGSANSFGSYLDTAHVYVYEAVNSLYATYEDVFNFIASDLHATVVSTSYGWPEDEFDPTGTEESVMHSIFNTMVGEGWTLIAAAGDQGSADGCQDAVRVHYPASDPDVVAAGGTAILMDTSNGDFIYEYAWTGQTYSTACVTNHGGGGGGVSAYFSQPSWQSGLVSGSSNRLMPDISLNAGAIIPQNYYYGGSWYGGGGTSIVAPELAGFFAQENAYLMYIGPICGPSGAWFCAPIGNPSPFIYYVGVDGAQKDPFYDTLLGCNSNNITAEYDLIFYCAGPGYDQATGWGSFNAMQFAWALNWQYIPADSAPSVAFTGPAVNTWYNTNQEVSWTVTDTNTSGSTPPAGVAGFTQGWDSIPADPYSEPDPGSGNSFYSGPQFPFAIAGCLSYVAGTCSGGVSQGLHTVYVEAWDNQGTTTTTTYGPIGYDTIAPVTTASVSGTTAGGLYVNLALVTLNASDPGYPTTGSGVASTVYQLNGGTAQTYGGAFLVGAEGNNTVTFHSVDVAGNVESTKSVSFSITSATTTTLTSSLNPAPAGKVVHLTAVVAPPITGTPTGTVTFRNGTTVLGTKTLVSGKAVLAVSTLPAGSNSLTASYNGASYFETSAGALTEVIDSTTTTTLASSLNPSDYDQPVTFTASIAPSAATGTVAFKNGAVVLGTATVSGGTATFTTSNLTVAAAGHLITAVYSGDSNYATSTSTALKQVVNTEGTTTTVESSLNPSTSGQTVTFTATVKSTGAGTPTGTVDFYDGATKLGPKALTAGNAAFSTSKLTAGTHSITAVYVGTSDFTTSTSDELEQVVNP